jgi:hypothetical protein
MGHHDSLVTLMNAAFFFTAVRDFFAPPLDVALLTSILPSVADCARCYA